MFTDDCHTGLLQPRETTSLWRVGQEDEPRVATIDELPQGTAYLQHESDADANSIYDGSWAVNVQLVKRDGAYRLLVDGMETTSNDNGVTMLLSHRGMLTNTTTTTRSPVSILSPCAVSVFVEDGQRPPQRCTVELIQGATGVVGTAIAGKETKLAEREFNHTSAAGVSSNIVVVPYPTKYPRHGRIAIYDLAKLYRFEGVRLKGRVVEFVGTLASLGLEMSLVPNYGTKAAVEAAARKASTSSGTWWSWGANMFSVTSDTTAADTVDDATVVYSSVVAAVSFLGLTFAFIGAAPLASILTTLVSSIGGGQGLAVLRFTGNAAEALFVAKGMLNGVVSWMNKPPAPIPTRVSFTINEFADALERLAEVVDVPTDAELEELSKTSKFKREILIFKWMLEAEDAYVMSTSMFRSIYTKTNAILTGRDRGLFKPNPIDLSEMKVSTNVSMFSQIEIVVEDDEICGLPHRARLRSDFGNQETDRHLAALAVGTLRSMHRLEMAIEQFRQSISRAIVRLPGDTTNHFFSAYMAGPILGFLREKNILPKKKYKESFKLLGAQSQHILRTIQGNFPAKFQKNFTNFDSPMQTYKRELESVAQNLFSPQLRPLSDDAGDARTLVRFLPHATDLALFFPASRAADIDYAENEEEDVSTAMRQHSAFSDSCKVYNDMATSALHLLNDMKDELMAIDFRHGYADPSADELGTFEDFGRSIRPKAQFNALNIHAPLSIVRAIDTEAVPEPIRIRLEAVTNAAASDVARTALSALGLPDTYHAFHAVSIISELLAEELVASGRAADGLHDTSALNRGPFQSAIERAVNAHALIGAHLKHTKSGLLLGRHQLLGTRMGRDAAMIVDSINIDSLERLQDRVRILRSTLSALDQTVRRLLSLQSQTSGRDGPLAIASRLPSEPLASLFQDKLSGMNAFLRVSSLVAYSGLDTRSTQVARVMWSVASSYASNQLVDVAERVYTLPVLTRPPSDAMECKEAVHRMARLRVDVEIQSVYELHTRSEPTATTGAETAEAAIDKLAIEFSNVVFSAKLAERQPAASALFYVPFGYGGKPYALKRPAAPPSLIGSVPMWCDDVRWGMERVLSSAIPADVPMETERITRIIRFVYNPCTLNNESVQRVLHSPLFVAVNTTGALTESVVYGAVPRSRPPRGREQVETSTIPGETLNALMRRFGYGDHTQSRVHASLNESISDVVWNADRIVQAAMAMLHVCGADGGYNTTVHVELLPGVPAEDTVGDDIREIEARLEDGTGEIFMGRGLSDELLLEQATVITEARLLYTGMRDLAATAERLASSEITTVVLDQTPFVGTPWARGLDSGEYASRVLTTPLGGDEDALYLARNAVRLLAMFKEGYPTSPDWGNPGVRDFFSKISQKDEYIQSSQSIDEAAASLKARFDELKGERDLQLQTLFERLKLKVANTRETANRTAESMVISAVIANATLSRIVGRSRANIALIGFDHPQLEDDFKSRIGSLLMSTIRVSGDDAPDQDVAKLSEVCAIMLSLL
jgi:hypothetical protein